MEEGAAAEKQKMAELERRKVVGEMAQDTKKVSRDSAALPWFVQLEYLYVTMCVALQLKCMCV
jgi:hypothetical protein